MESSTAHAHGYQKIMLLGLSKPGRAPVSLLVRTRQLREGHIAHTETGRDGTHGGGFVGRPSNLSLSWRSALVRVERVMPSSLMFSSGCFWM